MRKSFIILSAVAVMAATSGYFVATLVSPAALRATPPAVQTDAAVLTPPAPENLIGERRPDFALADANGRMVSSDSFDGDVLLLNFWATWCTPCVEEMPMLSRMQQQFAGQGVNIVGIALDDPERARQFAAGLGVEYTVLFGLADAMLVGRRYGNRAGMLPYSVLVDRAGTIRWTRLGILDRIGLETRLAELALQR